VFVGWLEVSQLVRWLLGWILALSLPLLPARTPQQRRTTSVLIPARNEASTLPHLLAALSHQILRPDEVIVIDDHSSDTTAAIASQAADTLPIRVIQPRLCRRAGQGRLKVRHRWFWRGCEHRVSSVGMNRFFARTLSCHCPRRPDQLSASDPGWTDAPWGALPPMVPAACGGARHPERLPEPA
jgi:cellulose synthase/poly-beta-1,6-N-acetylglucosamine synthase-like glycosyltransferase